MKWFFVSRKLADAGIFNLDHLVKLMARKKRKAL
jgi:hypothetical protein